MDGSQFDDLLRALSRSRRTMLGTALVAGGAITGLSAVDAKKKKKKKCAKKCADGCCTSKHGKCIKRAQQSSTQCGTGGEICRTNCEATTTEPPEICDSGCAGCCQGNACLPSTDEHCGFQGRACVACGAKEECGLAGTCCGLEGHACTNDDICCQNRLCNTDLGKCCSTNSGPCESDLDCCNPDSSVCVSGQCQIKVGSPCTLLQVCEGNRSCPSSLICGGVGCELPCADFGRCTEYTCFGDLLCCPADVTDDCNVPDLICECIIEGGYCTRV